MADKSDMRFSVVFLCLLAIGCGGHRSKPIAYQDQRSITTRPVKAGQKSPDVIVRVQWIPVPKGTTDFRTPAQSKPAMTAESLASFGVPFYYTVQDRNYRIELGGKIVQ